MREPVVLILDPDSVYGADLIDSYYTEHGLRCVLGFTGRRARVLAFTTVPAAHSRAVAARVDLTGDVTKDHHDLARRFDIRAVPAYQELWVEYATAFLHLLGLHWNPPEVVARFRDKFALKQWIRDHAPDVRMNASRMVGSVREVLDEPGPSYRRFVLKPPDGVGNENVLIVDDTVDPQRIARHFAESVAPGGACVMEEYIDGEEYYVDGQVDAEGNVTPIAVQHYRRGRLGDRSNIALGHVTVRPGELHFDAILEYASHVIAATGLRRSPFHMEVKVDDSGPCLIECGARLVGWAAALEDSAAHGPQLDVVRVAGALLAQVRPHRHSAGLRALPVEVRPARHWERHRKWGDGAHLRGSASRVDACLLPLGPPPPRGSRGDPHRLHRDDCVGSTPGTPG